MRDTGPAELARGGGGIWSDIGFLPLFLIALPMGAFLLFGWFQQTFVMPLINTTISLADQPAYKVAMILSDAIGFSLLGAAIGVSLIFTRTLGLSARLPPMRFIRNAVDPWGDDLRLSGLTALDIDLAVFVSSLMRTVRRLFLGMAVVILMTTGGSICVTVATLYLHVNLDLPGREQAIAEEVKGWFETMSYLMPYLLFVFIYIQTSAAYSLSVTFCNLARFSQPGPWAIIRREASEGWSFFKTHLPGTILAYSWTQLAKTNDWVMAMVTGILFLLPTLPILYISTRRYWSRDAGSLGRALRNSGSD